MLNLYILLWFSLGIFFFLVQVNFVRQLILLCLHLLSLTTAVFLRNPKDNQPLVQKIFCHIAEACVVGGCIMSIFALQAKEIYLQGFNYYLQNLVNRYLLIFSVQACLQSTNYFCIEIILPKPLRFQLLCVRYILYTRHGFNIMHWIYCESTIHALNWDKGLTPSLTVFKKSTADI